MGKSMTNRRMELLLENEKVVTAASVTANCGEIGD
jgi:hypothetical protein